MAHMISYYFDHIITTDGPVIAGTRNRGAAAVAGRLPSMHPKDLATAKTGQVIFQLIKEETELTLTWTSTNTSRPLNNIVIYTNSKSLDEKP